MMSCIKESLNLWECRGLTLAGRIQIFKSLALSKTIYTSTMIYPSKKFMDQLLRWPITVTATANYSSTNEMITMTTKTSHQNQIAHSTNKMLTAQTKTLIAQAKTFTAQTKTFTAQTKTLTAQTKTLTAPRNRGSLLCLFLNLKK